jgi:hypothetical protein
MIAEDPHPLEKEKTFMGGSDIKYENYCGSKREKIF